MRLELKHEFRAAGQQTIRYADWMAGPSYLTPETDWARDQLAVGLGFGLTNSDSWRLDLDLGGEFGRDQMLGTLQAEVAVKF